ncbi:MAG: BMP family ABC transporter substrate-binding protein, partial [Gracilibacteraceae bacterium]|nr:BMP family ABC transporter substrate-binding protein [Gracilibacteraceae bacterium]
GGVASVAKRPGGPSGNKQKNGNNKNGGKKKMVFLIILGVVVLMLAVGVALYLIGKPRGITTVMTNPTKDVVLITGPEGLDDPVAANIWQGIEEASQKNSLTAGYIVPKADTEKEFNAKLDEACRDYRIVVCYGQDLADNLLIKVQTYPQANFLFFEGTILTGEGETSTFPNVLEVGFRVEEASYLAGYLAFKINSGNSLGFVGGKDEPALRAYYGFYAGVMHASNNPGYEIRSGLPGSAADGYKRVKTLASDIYKDGAGIIYHSVGSHYGQAIAEAARQDNKKVIASGRVPENAGSEVLMTVVKNYDVVVKDLLEKSTNNSLPYGERVYYGYTENALSLPKPAKDVSDSLWNQAEDLRNKIIKGERSVPGNQDEFDYKVQKGGW